MDFFNFLKSKKELLFGSGLIFNIILSISTLILLICLLIQNNQQEILDSDIPKDIIKESDNVLENEKIDTKYYVEIKGAVKKPGVYEVNSDSIINDVVTLASGFTDSAYTDNINLSKKVTNELVIYVYTKSEYKKKNQEEVIIKEKPCVCPSYDISSCTDNYQSEIIPDDKSNNTSTNSSNSSSNDTSNPSTSSNNEENNPSSNEEVHLVNINTATLEELMTLTGIGEAKAKDIILYRETNGLFKTKEEIKKVNGIKDATYNKIKDNITV